jgi:hypothetical protein
MKLRVALLLEVRRTSRPAERLSGSQEGNIESVSCSVSDY